MEGEPRMEPSRRRGSGGPRRSQRLRRLRRERGSGMPGARVMEDKGRAEGKEELDRAGRAE